MTNLASLLESHPFADDEELLLTIDRAVTVGEARNQARAFAAELKANGVEPGQAIIVQRPNSPEAVVAMVGTWLAGAVYVPAGIRQPRAEVEASATIMKPAALIGPHRMDRSHSAPARCLSFPRVWNTGLLPAMKCTCCLSNRRVPPIRAMCVPPRRGRRFSQVRCDQWW